MLTLRRVLRAVVPLGRSVLPLITLAAGGVQASDSYSSIALEKPVDVQSSILQSTVVQPPFVADGDGISSLNNLSVEPEQANSAMSYFLSIELVFALFAFVLIALLCAALCWGLSNYLKLRKLREKSQIENTRLLTELDIAYAKKNQMLATMSHDICQPLQALSYLTAGLHASDKENGEVNRQIKSVTEQVSELVNTLFEISKFDNELVLPNYAIVNVEHILQDLSHTYFSLVTSHGIQLHINQVDAWLKTDANLLKHALGILVENAVKHSSATHIWVESETDEYGRTLIKVRDNGRGIPEEEWSKIFDEFYQMESHRKSRKVGMGLGLSLFSRLTELLEIRCYLAHPKIDSLYETYVGGPGIEFVLEMPELSLTENKSAAVSETIEYKRRRQMSYENKLENNISVWIVDADNAISSAMSLMLKQWGLSPQVFADYQEVKSAMTRLDPPDIVITQHVVAGIESGEMLIENIRAQYHKGIEACLISQAARVSSVRVDNAVRVDNVHRLERPVSPYSVFEILYNVVERKRKSARNGKSQRLPREVHSSVKL